MGLSCKLMEPTIAQPMLPNLFLLSFQALACSGWFLSTDWAAVERRWVWSRLGNRPGPPLAAHLPPDALIPFCCSRLQQ